MAPPYDAGDPGALLSGTHAGTVEKNTPALTVPQVRLLPAAELPRRSFAADEALALLRSVQRRSAVATAAHCKRQKAWSVDMDWIVTDYAP